MTPATMTPASVTLDIDPTLFRGAVGRYASGITIITCQDDEGPIGFTCQSFYSVSIDPPLVSFSVMKTSTTYPRIRDTGAFAVNILSSEQEAASNQFARRGPDKWANIKWTPSEQGSPIIEDSLAWLDCSIWAEYEAGDHTIVVGRVVGLGTAAEQDLLPLLYSQGKYHTHRTATSAGG